MAVSILWPDSEGIHCLDSVVIADVETDSVWTCADAAASFSGVHGWCASGLICTLPPDEGILFQRSRVVLVPCHEAEDNPGVPTDAFALVRSTYPQDVLGQLEQDLQLTAHIASSPCGTWLAILSGVDLTAWSVQVVRIATGCLIAEWQGPYGPCEADSERTWRLTWSLDGRSISVGVDGNRAAYSATYQLAMDG